MDPLQVNVLLQLSPQVDLRPVLAHRPIIHQDEVRVETVEHVQLAQGVQQGLVWGHHLHRERANSAFQLSLSRSFSNDFAQVTFLPLSHRTIYTETLCPTAGRRLNNPEV